MRNDTAKARASKNRLISALLCGWEGMVDSVRVRGLVFLAQSSAYNGTR